MICGHGYLNEINGQNSDLEKRLGMTQATLARRPEGFPGQRLVIVPSTLVAAAVRQPVTRDLCVTHIGHFSAAGGHFVERKHGTSEHVLIVCISGAGTCRLAGNEWRMEPGSVLFLPPKQYHIYAADERFPWTICWVHFRGQRANDYRRALGVSDAAPLLSVGDPAVLFEAFEDTFQHVTHGFNEAALIGLSTSFTRLLGLARVHQHRSDFRSHPAERRILKALALMRDDLARPWTLRELAGEAHLSIPHFTELCRRQAGMPAIGLLTRLRLQHAMNLLQQGSHNVAEAAAAVGYDDPFYFSRLFRKHMGTPPSSCRHGP
jgi:AraC family transcriptional regulator of arabinose operon